MDGAKDATRSGMWCAVLVSGVTALFALLALAGIRIMGARPSALLDAVLFAGIAYGLFRFSRVAAVAGVALYLIEKIYALRLTRSILGVGVLGVVILFAFFNGMRGAFAYHKLSSATAAQTATSASLGS